jgi:hypothetical protein
VGMGAGIGRGSPSGRDVAQPVGSCCSTGTCPLAHLSLMSSDRVVAGLPIGQSCVRTEDDHSTLRIDQSPRPPSPHLCSDSEWRTKNHNHPRDCLTYLVPVVPSSLRAAGEPRLASLLSASSL